LGVPPATLGELVHFIKHSLLPYTPDGKDQLPLVLGGEHSKPLIHFFRNKLNLIMNNDPITPTTRSGTTIDMIFIRYLPNVQSRTYISYFSYHRPIISTFPKEISTDESSDEYMEIDELEQVCSNPLFFIFF